MTLLKWAAAALLLYVAIVAALYAFQRALLYPVPQTVRTTPAAAGFAEAEEVFVTTRDGERVILWHVPPKPGRPVVMFFHGNGEVLAWRVPRFRALAANGTGLVAVSFRGYGGSSGRPTEPGLLDDGAAAYEFAAKQYLSRQIVPWGYSLGSGVAVAIATNRPVGGLILEAPYTSVTDVASSAFPFVPVRWLLRDRFHSDELISGLTAPLLVMHGEKDTVIAAAFGRRLYSLAPGRKRYVAFEHGTHIDLDEQGAIAEAHAFLDEVRKGD